MREITTHKVNGLNECLEVWATDEPGVGGACHDYVINVNDPNKGLVDACSIFFQNGPIKESGVNGVSIEALLAIVQDHLEGFQNGEFACTDNMVALDAVKFAMAALQERTRDRLQRGVEGTLEQ